MKRILLISAHPDDVEIGMGGTIATLAHQQYQLTSVILTDGGRSPCPFAISQQELIQTREQEAQKAATVLGIEQVHFFRLSGLSEISNYQTAVIRLSELIHSLTPQEVFTLHPELDRHPTHRLAGKALLEAVAHCNHNPAVWAYEVWGLFSSWDRYEDISNTIGLKMKAIAQHRSQVASAPYGEGVAGLNHWRGVFMDPHQSEVSAQFAEVFIRLS